MNAPHVVRALVAVSCVVLFASSILHAQRPPLCDVTCGPDPTDPSYGGLLAARAMKQNARGTKNPMAAYAPGPLKVPMIIGSQSYNRAIPILSLPGRGLDLNLTLWYNSRIWDFDAIHNTITLNADRDFPSYGFRLDFGFLEYDANNAQMILTESDGTKHALPLTANITGGAIYDSNDGTFIEYNSASSVSTYRNGVMMTYEPFPSLSTLFRPVQIMDTNRNYISISYVTGAGNDQHIDTITDTLNRVIKFVYVKNAAQQDLLRQIVQLNVAPGTPGRDSNGNRVWATFAWSEDTTPYVLKYAFSPTVVSSQQNNTTIDVLTGCTYPNQTGYKFSYGDWGIVNRIDQLSAPSNPNPPAIRAYESYNFPAASSSQPLADAPAYTTMTVSRDGASTSVWNYSAQQSAPGQITSQTVTDPLGTATKLTLNNDGTLSSVQVTDNTGKVFRTVNYTWKSVGSSTMVGSIATTDDAGNQSSVSYGYDSNGNVNDLKEFDFGATLVRETVTTYMGAPYSGPTGSHVLNLPQSIQIKDASGSVRSRTDFNYDESTRTALSPFPTHNDGNTTAPRGNLTSITRYPLLSDLSKTIVRTFTFDVAGNLTVAHLDCCNQKKFNFDPASQYAYLSSVVRGPDGGQQFTTSFSFAFDSGLPQNTTDENNQPTSFQYDNMYRVTQVTPPSPGPQQTIVYGDDLAIPKVTTSSTANNTQTIQTFDGLGHLLRQDFQDKNASAPFSTIQLQYDPIWRRAATSNPYAPGETVIWNNTGYDALSRVISVTPPSGGGSSFTFLGNTVLLTDPAGKQRKNFFDGLGRLVRVDEPGWGDAIAAIDSIALSGAERSKLVTTRYCAVFGVGGRCLQWDTTTDTVYDTGTVTATIGGTPYSQNYGQNDSPASIAQNLALKINNDPNRVVDASPSGSTINLSARTAGAAANGISVSASSTTTDPTDFGSGTTSFPVSTFQPTLFNGDNAVSQDNAVLTALRHLTTTYAYDVFDHLTSLSQGAMDHVNGNNSFAAQPRSYSYDDLGRLTSSTTPESGTVTNYYTNADGALCSGGPSLVCRITDARNITKTFTYNDPLNRLTGVTYSDGVTPAVSYTYDVGGQAAFALGRLTGITEGANSLAFTYDNLGRITAVTETIDGVNYPLHYAYNAANQMTSLTYPSGRVVTPDYDVLGHLNQITEPNAPKAYLTVNSADYTAAGQIKQLAFGNGVTGQFSYNDHRQIASLRYFNPSAAAGTPDVLNLSYDYTSTAQPNNNGQIQAIHYFTTPGVEDQTRSESFTYDAWFRLKHAQTLDQTAATAWTMNWGYDQLGNRLSQSGTGNYTVFQPAFTVNPATNRIDGYCYDNAGNLTDQAACPAAGSPHQYTYDGANRLTSINGTAAQYTYFGPLRIKKVTGSGTTIYIYSVTKPIAEYAPGAALTSPLKEYVYAGSQLLATLVGGTPTYHHPDPLSNRAETDSTANVIRRFGHFPYGETWYENGTTDKWKFTPYERDSGTGETGLDYAMFRQFSAGQGRFMSADLMGGHLPVPGSLNRYTYVRNDPVNLMDPLGLFWNCTRETSTTPNGTTHESGWHCTWIDDGCPPMGECSPGSPPNLSFGPPSPLPNLFPEPPQVPRFAPSAECLQKILDAISKALGLSAKFLGPTNMQGATGDTDPANKPGWRNGAWNFDFFGPGITTLPDWFQGRDPNSGLHLPPPGGADPVTPMYGPGTYYGQPGFYFTGHFDSSNPVSGPGGFLKHVIGDVLLKLPHGC